MSNDPSNPNNAPPPGAPPAAPQPATSSPAWSPFGPAAPPPVAPAAPAFAPPMPAPMPAPVAPFAAPMPAPMQPFVPQPAMPAAPAPQAPVIGARDLYRFAEEPVAQKAQVTILETPKVAPELPSPTRIDPNFEQLKIALEAQMARNAIAPMMYAPPNATRWFRFSPFELFLEQVLAKKLWTLE